MELQARFIRSLSMYVGWLFIPIYYLYSLTKTDKLPPIKQPHITNKSATYLARKIRSKEITSEAVVKAFIERIRDVNPIINAVVEDRFADAIQDAKKVDEFISKTNKTPEQIERETPFLGVPITVKEACSLAGMSYSVGATLRAGVKAEEDGTAVAYFKKAGAIPLLVSNTPELCGSIETYNKITGYTNNPYDLHRTAGGSSGGEAALISSGASVLGIGSDLAGSIRVPSLYTGIFGHKPTPGIVPNHGHNPSVDDKEFQKLLNIGPMARYAEDLKPALKVMAGPVAEILNLDKEVNIKDINIYYITDFGFSFTEQSVDWEIKNSIINTVEYLKQTHGCHVEQLHLKDLEDCFEINIMKLAELEGPEKLLNLKGEDESLPLVELLKVFCNMSDYCSVTVGIKIILTNLLFIPRQKQYKYKEKRNNLLATLNNTLKDNGVLIFPTFPQVAFYKYQLLWKLSSIAYPMIVNVLGLPATQIPVGLNKEKLPFGFQVTAAPKQDRLCLAVANELEKVYGGWIPPPST